MEVHAHTQTGPIAIGRKKFTHYLWEFLMLFLAVFCGFLAEYQLEHIIENKREKQYIHSLSEDLRSDIKQIDNISVQLERKIRMMDSVISDLSVSPSLSCLRNLY